MPLFRNNTPPISPFTGGEVPDALGVTARFAIELLNYSGKDRAMENGNCHVPHLTMLEIILPPGQEWKPQLPGWSIFFVRSGLGYCLETQVNTELPTGSVLVLADTIDANFHASQLAGMSLVYFRIAPELLTGLTTAGEQCFFEDAAVRREFSFQLLSGDHPVAAKFKDLCVQRNRKDFGYRLQLLGMFGDVFAGLANAHSVPDTAAPQDARARLRQFLDQSPASEWLNLSFAEVVERINCTPRHLSRIFRELTGMSFREKQAKIRLLRARELLASTESKVVDVALDSGFQSLNLFNLMFRRRFGLSPGKWRKEGPHGARKIALQRKQQPFVACKVDAVSAGA